MPKKTVFSLAILAFTMAATAAYAQYGMPSPTPLTVATPAPLVRTMLRTVDFPAQYQTIENVVVIAPGATAASHTHPGLEVGYVLEGEADLYVQGQPKVHVKAGDSFVNPAGVPHGAVNTNKDKPFKLVNVYVIEKGKPVATPAAPFF